MATEAENLPENVPNHQESGVDTQGDRGQNQSVGLRDHMEPFLLYSKINLNRYITMTSISYLTK